METNEKENKKNRNTNDNAGELTTTRRPRAQQQTQCSNRRLLIIRVFQPSLINQNTCWTNEYIYIYTYMVTLLKRIGNIV